MVRAKKTDINQYNKPFPTILRKHLEAPGMTQQLLADHVGVKRQTVAQWKDGITTPDIESLSKIADYFKVNTDYLLGRIDCPTNNMNVRNVAEWTGLSDEAIELISALNINAGFRKTINMLLVNPKMIVLIFMAADLITLDSENKAYYLKKNNDRRSSAQYRKYKVDSISLNKAQDVRLNPQEYYEYKKIQIQNLLGKILEILAEEHLNSIEDIIQVVESRQPFVFGNGDTKHLIKRRKLTPGTNIIRNDKVVSK